MFQNYLGFKLITTFKITEPIKTRFENQRL